LSRWVQTMMFGVSPTDAATIMGAVGVLTMVGVLAALGPARRAARIDPILSLRAE